MTKAIKLRLPELNDSQYKWLDDYIEHLFLEIVGDDEPIYPETTLYNLKMEPIRNARNLLRQELRQAIDTILDKFGSGYHPKPISKREAGDALEILFASHMSKEGPKTLDLRQEMDGPRPFLVEPGWEESVFVAHTNGPNYRVLFYKDGSMRFEHDCFHEKDGLIICAPLLSSHKVVAKEPLTILPSILCSRCNIHGFVREGRWSE